MGTIRIERKAAQETLEGLEVKSWPIWEKEVSSFPWHYDSTETCYILEGRFNVELDNGESFEIKAGDLVTFPQGLSCTWTIYEPVRKHYSFA
jgi:uncharacterized cupin superfamily protein